MKGNKKKRFESFEENSTYMERANAALLLSALLFESSKATNRSTVPI